MLQEPTLSSTRSSRMQTLKLLSPRSSMISQAVVYSIVHRIGKIMPKEPPPSSPADFRMYDAIPSLSVPTPIDPEMEKFQSMLQDYLRGIYLTCHPWSVLILASQFMMSRPHQLLHRQQPNLYPISDPLLQKATMSGMFSITGLRL